MKIRDFFTARKISVPEGTEVGETPLSKVKIGAFLVALAAIIATVGNILAGNATWVNGGLSLLTEIGALLAVFGIRDIPILNSVISIFQGIKPSETGTRKK